MGSLFRARHRHLRLGRRGEKLAAVVLREAGLDILARNFTAGRDEIDIVARNESVLCFVEVKTRRREGLYSPARAVGREKQKRIVRAARKYLHKIGDPKLVVRFDVVEVVLDAFRLQAFRYWPHAFTSARAGRK